MELPATAEIRTELARIMGFNDASGFGINPDHRNQSMRPGGRNARVERYFQYLNGKKRGTFPYINQKINQVSLECRQRIFALNSIVTDWDAIKGSFDSPNSPGSLDASRLKSDQPPAFQWVRCMYSTMVPHISGPSVVEELQNVYVDLVNEFCRLGRQGLSKEENRSKVAELDIREERMISTFKRLVQEGKIDPSLYIFNTSNASDKVYHLHPFLDNGSIMEMMDEIMESFPKETK